MFNDIAKILKSVKKGVVIVENGKPAYVVVPFEEYQESAKGERYRSVEMWADAREKQMDDIHMIQKMIDYETSMRTQGFSGGQETEIKMMLNSLEQERGQRREPRGQDEGGRNIQLEDLPF